MMRRPSIEVTWAYLEAIAEEMQATLVRTAFSAGIRDAGDCSCAIFDRRGRLVAQASTAPGQLGSMPFLLTEFLRRVDSAELADGDVFVTNDPWLGCGHTPDIYVIAPLYIAGHLLAYASISGHHADVGGRLGSHESTEVYEEGLQIPVVHLRRAGLENREIVEVLRANSRRPDELIGDLRAQVAGLSVADRRLRRLVESNHLDPERLEAVTTEIAERSERAVRAAIRAVPDGTYRGSLRLDDRAGDGSRLVIDAAVAVEGDALHVDFAGTSPQVNYPINSVLNYSRAYVFAGVKMALAPTVPANAGSMACVAVSAPPGTIVNAAFPAPVRWRTTVGLMIPDVIFGALAAALPDRIPAGNGTVPRWHEVLYTRGSDGFIIQCHYMGGMGAVRGRDGLSAVAWPANIREVPLEYLEHDSPLVVGKKSYRTDSGGAGTFRGGLGQEVVFRNPRDWPTGSAQPVVASVNSGRIVEGAPGLDGGAAGERGAVLLDGQPIVGNRGEVVILPGSELALLTPGGGGVGPPAGRSRGMIAEDVARGFVSIRAAREVYGWVGPVAGDQSPRDDHAPNWHAGESVREGVRP